MSKMIQEREMIGKLVHNKFRVIKVIGRGSLGTTYFGILVATHRP